VSAALLNRLAKVEATLKPTVKWFSTERIVRIDEPEEQEIAPAEIERLISEGYRPGIDQIVVIRVFPCGEANSQCIQ
jgi:hypothetical protein